MTDKSITINLTEYELDALKEICGIASAKAANALAQLLGKKISMKVPDIYFVPIEEATELMGGAETLVAGIYSQIVGEMRGGLLLTFPRQDVLAIADILLKEQNKSSTPILDEFRSSAVQEVGNIISGAFVSAIGAITRKTLLITVPHVTFDMLGAILDFILIELAIQSDYALILKVHFSDEPQTISGHFFITPDPESLKILMETIKNFNK